MSIRAAWGETLLLLREGGLQAINLINVQPRLIKACPKVVSCGRVCVSVCECVCEYVLVCMCMWFFAVKKGDDRLVVPIKHLTNEGQGLHPHAVKKASSVKPTTSKRNRQLHKALQLYI